MNKDRQLIRDIARRVQNKAVSDQDFTPLESSIAELLQDAGYTAEKVAQLEPHNEIAVIWHIEDVLDQAEQRGLKLTDEDAREILETASRKHDATEGITWDVLQVHIDGFCERRDKEVEEQEAISPDMRKQIAGNEYLSDLPARRQKLACQIWNIVKTAIGRDPSTGGCRPFYSVEEWRSRGEEHGLNSEIIICHDGGDFASVLNPSYGNREAQELVREMLAMIGYYVEPCTCWYAAVYKLN